jgi:hypothetical protein
VSPLHLEIRMRLTVLGLTAAALVAASQPAFAQVQADRDDARCVLVMNLLAQDQQQQGPASMGLFYFLGRIDARGATDKLEGLLKTEQKGLESEATFKAEFARCGDVMTKRSAALNTMYGRLDAAEKAEHPAGPAPAPAAPAKAPAKPPAK